jgi:hypothetical protein
MAPVEAREICYFTRFPPAGRGGGGTHRMLQIRELLGTERTLLVSSARRDWLPAEARKGAGTAGGWQDVFGLMGLEWFMWSRERRPVVLRLRGIAREWAKALGDGSGIRLAVVDDPVYFRPLIRRLNALRIPRVAVCHNLEACSPSQAVPQHRDSLLKREIEDLARCDRVIAISPEDEKVLRQADVRAVHLEYFPAEEIRRRLVKIRRRRECGGPRQGILALGSVLNAETFAAMRQVVQAWPALAPACGPLRIAGFGTERLQEGAPAYESVNILGTLSDDELDDILARIGACLCYQEGGGGVLTRIPEMLLAGVPVVANHHAARSYHGCPGLVEFADLAELAELLPHLPGMVEAFPPPAIPETDFLKTDLESLLR